ncbi:HPr family phosphocarrier protein [Spiribacter onubensis]|uniref:HPr family phosphocarrier protein n=1 Tax=Spiribacter onubensis TaxID=3122420 RepID=A0ABV3S6Y7_9GAMM
MAADSPIQEAEFEIINRLGLHARAAARFVAVASDYEAAIEVRHDGNEANGKSIMGLMMLAAGQGSRLTVTARGDDGPRALEALGALLADRFGEAD